MMILSQWKAANIFLCKPLTIKYLDDNWSECRELTRKPKKKLESN